MNLVDSDLMLAKHGLDAFSDNAAHTCNAADTTNSRTPCDHWQGLWLDAGAQITALTLITGQEVYGLAALGALTSSAFFPVKFTGATVTGRWVAIRKKIN